MRFLLLGFGLVLISFNISFAQQPGNLKILNHEEPSDPINSVEKRKVDESNRSGLNAPGWQFEQPIRPNDLTSESGKIVFEIEANKEGKIIVCKVSESSVSNTLLKVYRDAVVKSKLKPSTSGTKPESGAKGTVTFIIGAR